VIEQTQGADPIMETDPIENITSLTALSALRRFVRPRARPSERCELCDAGLAEEHNHLVEVADRRLVCACDPCAILFAGQSGTKYRRVPRRVKLLTDFRLSDEAWEGLQLPIDLAFFLRSTRDEKVVALYPSPAGATESLVSLEAWQTLMAENPALAGFEPDVEALLVNRVGATRECYRVGVDVCYTLVGLIRMHWKGLSGGAKVWGEIAGFFENLRKRSA
jgi:hypothetical protein